MNNPKVSIVIPIYKVPEKFLRQCIESCINQTLKDIEIILVDDGSPDNCGKICDEYAAKDNRIKVIHKKNGGLVSARNAGYEVSQGEWITYLDGDDWLDDDCLECILKPLGTHQDVDIIFWKCVQELGNKQIKGKWEWPCKESHKLYVADECKKLARNTLVYKSGIATAYCKLIHRSYATKFNIKHDDRLKQGAEGLEFSLRAFYYSHKALFVNSYAYHYRFNPSSISKSINEKNTQYLIDCLNVIREDILHFDNPDVYTHAFYQRVAYILIAIGLNTYFNPNNKDSLRTKTKKYSNVIKSNKIFYDSIRCCNTEGMNRSRKITFFFIKYKLYFMLSLVAKAKLFMLKRGKYNY